jgi:hypothetical protein
MIKFLKVIIFSLLLTIFSGFLNNHKLLADNLNFNNNTNTLESFQLTLPKFMQNFINNINQISVEKITPEVQNSNVGKLMTNPMNSQTQKNFFNKAKDWLNQTSQKINDFFKVDVGNVFSKIMNLFICGFNKAVEWVENLFTD